MPQPTINTTVTENRRRTRPYDAKTGIANALQSILDYIVSPYVTAVNVGDLKPTVNPTPDAGWLLCDGSTFDAAANPELSALLGGNTLPDFRNRVPMGAGGAYAALSTGGAASVSLSVAQLPPHDHPVNDAGHTHTVTDAGHTHTETGVVQTAEAAVGVGQPVSAPAPATTGPAQTGITINNAQSGVTVGNAGGGDPIDITPPYVGIYWWIKT
ncbi:phage tail protein [Thalassobius sp. Cn5-15]|uniref:phage tail protein n=1 Tax=Thalassobius sp. Cn5-15 TaxID=2917763 RepID=UPI001EF32E70|nr:tail fiber protein [Thalassobius sp. Cn5-15]MCG7492467.1 tail fiber protein [Thalassobius sp. Cn5-15]